MTGEVELSFTHRVQREKTLGRRTLKGKRNIHEDPRLKLLADCARNGWAERLVKLMGSEQCPVQLAIDNAFLLACEHGHLDVVRLLAQRVTSVNFVGREGAPALLLAARKGHVAVAEFVLQCGVSIEVRDENGDTALLAAVEAGMEEMVGWLIVRGADVNALDDDRNSALHVAAFCGDLALVKVLLNAGAVAYGVNDEDETPLECSSHPAVVEVILQHFQGVSVDACDEIEEEDSVLRRLPSGSASGLFWAALGVGRDSTMFAAYRSYPFDRLNDAERVLVLDQVCSQICGTSRGTKRGAKRNKRKQMWGVLQDSALLAVFSMVKSRVHRELHVSEAEDNTFFAEHAFEWRSRVLGCYEQLYPRSSGLGLCEQSRKPLVWDGLVDEIARFVFGRGTWKRKKQLLQYPHACDRVRYASGLGLSAEYCRVDLPSMEELSGSSVQLAWKRLQTLSSGFLGSEAVVAQQESSTGCICADCLKERQVPLSLRLQFAQPEFGIHHAIAGMSPDEFSGISRNKGKRIAQIEDKPEHFQDEEPLSEQLSELVQTHRVELGNFWESLSTEEKWSLTELPLVNLEYIISRSALWETLRSALDSYRQYSWDDDHLEISQDCVSVVEDVDVCGAGGQDVLSLMFGAVISCSSSLIEEGPVPQYKGASDKMSEEEWDLKGRRILEELVLGVFAGKIVGLYMRRKEESRAQRAALELELELLQEEEEQERKAKKKKRKRKGKGKKNKAVNEVEEDEVEVENDPVEEEEDDELPTGDSNPFLVLAKDTKVSVGSSIHEDADSALIDDSAEVMDSHSESEDDPQSDDDISIGDDHASRNHSDYSETNQHEYEYEPNEDDQHQQNSSSSNEFPTAGMMFICTDETLDEIMQLSLLGLPRQHLRSVKALDPNNCALFLFNISSRLLHGIYEADGPGQENINPAAWSRQHRHTPKSSPFPAQIRFRVVEEFEPIPEAAFRHLFPDGNRIRRLNAVQIREICRLFMDLDVDLEEGYESENDPNQEEVPVEVDVVVDDSQNVEQVLHTTTDKLEQLEISDSQQEFDTTKTTETILSHTEQFVLSTDPLVQPIAPPPGLVFAPPQSTSPFSTPRNGADSPSLMLFGGWDNIWRNADRPWERPHRRSQSSSHTSPGQQSAPTFPPGNVWGSPQIPSQWSAPGTHQQQHPAWNDASMPTSRTPPPPSSTFAHNRSHQYSQW